MREGSGVAKQAVDLNSLHNGQVINKQLELRHPGDFVDSDNVILIQKVVFEYIRVLATQLDQHGPPAVTKLDLAALPAKILQVERRWKLLAFETEYVS